MRSLIRGLISVAGAAAVTLVWVPGSASAVPVPAGQPVSNPYSPAYGHAYRHGVVPTIEQHSLMRQHAGDTSSIAAGNTLQYGGGIDGIGVTSGPEKVYLVFWGTQWGTQSTDGNGNLTFSSDTAGGAPKLQNMFKGLGTGGELWSGVMTQYCDGPNVSAGATSCASNTAHVAYPSGGALAGVWYDNAAAEPSAASGHQIGVEAVRAAQHFSNTTPASNRFAQYVILSPKGLNPDNYRTGGFCAWHDYNGDSTLSGGGAVSSPVGDVAFTNMPYVMDAGTSCGQNFVNSGSAGTVDGYTIVEGHEYSETITDQNPAGGWTASSGEENADECAWRQPGTQGGAGNVSMGNGSYPEQGTWSNDTNRCDLSHPIVTGGGGGGGGCSGQKLGNPGFESGNTVWAATAGVIGQNGSQQPTHSGSWNAWLNGYGTSHTDTLSQSVSIPTGCHATLSFFLHIDTAESGSTVFDRLTVAANSTTLGSFSNVNAAAGYTSRSFDVSSFAGQTVTIKFTGVEDASLQTSFVVDDTALTLS